MSDVGLWRDPKNGQYCSMCKENDWGSQEFREFEEDGKLVKGWICLLCRKHIDGYSCNECGEHVEYDDSFCCLNCQDSNYGTCPTCWEKIGGIFDGTTLHNECGEE